LPYCVLQWWVPQGTSLWQAKATGPGTAIAVDADGAGAGAGPGAGAGGGAYVGCGAGCCAYVGAGGGYAGGGGCVYAGCGWAYAGWVGGEYALYPAEGAGALAACWVLSCRGGKHPTLVADSAATTAHLENVRILSLLGAFRPEQLRTAR
jgi:hypothetical protein